MADTRSNTELLAQLCQESFLLRGSLTSYSLKPLTLEQECGTMLAPKRSFDFVDRGPRGGRWEHRGHTDTGGELRG